MGCYRLFISVSSRQPAWGVTDCSFLSPVINLRGVCGGCDGDRLLAVSLARSVPSPARAAVPAVNFSQGATGTAAVTAFHGGGGGGGGAASFRCHNHHSESPATVVHHLCPSVPSASGPFLIAKWTKYFSCAANSQWTFSHGKTDMLFFTCSQWTFSRGKMDIVFFTCSQWTFSHGKMDMVFFTCSQ